MHPPKCPHCGVSWEEEETIYEHFLKKYSDEERAREIAKLYGCTPESPKHFGKNVTGIEIPEMYDGVSYWKCLKCDSTFDRWTMNKI